MTATLRLIGPETPLIAEKALCVLVADHDGLARGAVRAALSDAGGVRKVVCSGDAREAVEHARYHRPAVALVDTALPYADGIGTLVGALLQASPATRVVTIAVDDDDGGLEALRAGAVGHLGKDIDPETIAREIQRAADGEAVVPRRLTTRLLALVHQLPDAGWRPVHSRLTTREWEVVDLLADGADTRSVADGLFLSTTTVYSHIKNVMSKLGVHSRGEAIVAARELRHQEALGGNLPNGFG